MKTLPSSYTTSEIKEMMDRDDLTVNTTYQRSSDIWPSNARSYFIDTILEGYPFPKVYFYEIYDKKRNKIKREIVDGQQRITTIVDFLNDKIRLNVESRKYKGFTFSGLPENIQIAFRSYPVPIDIITTAEKGELLEMFRRINAYTAPLTPAEKRHSQFKGKFKWFINELADKYSPLLEEYGILTSKQILRMSDAELISELAIVLDQGIINKSSKNISDIYKKYDNQFAEEQLFRTRISDFFDELSTALSSLRSTFMMKTYVIHSLFCSMIHHKYGIQNGERMLGVPSKGYFYKDIDKTIIKLTKLADAHETQDTSGEFKSYVLACTSTTHRISQRTTRTKEIFKALI